MPRVNQQSSSDLLETKAAGSKSNNASEKLWMYYSVNHPRYDVYLSYSCIYKALLQDLVNDKSSGVTRWFCLQKAHSLHCPAILAGQIT